MYERTSNSGHTIVWEPDNTDVASRCMAAVDGTGCSTPQEAKEGENIDLDDKPDVRQKVKSEYQDMVSRFLLLTPESGRVPAKGAGSETVTVNVVNGKGDVVDYNGTVDIEVDEMGVKEVDVSGGSGTVDITTSKPVGGFVAIQAVNADGLNGEEKSKKKVLDVVE